MEELVLESELGGVGGGVGVGWSWRGVKMGLFCLLASINQC